MLKFIYKRLPNFSTSKANFYQILEVPEQSTQKQIKANYLRLAKVYHPDIYKGTDKNRFKLIQEAYTTLKSPEKRKVYDELTLKKSYQEESKNQAEEEQDDHETEEKPSHDNKTTSFKFKHKDYKEAKEKSDYSQEFQDFMQQPIKTDPENVQIYENILRRQLTKEEKEHHDYVFLRKNYKKYIFTHMHLEGYYFQVNQYIQTMNQQFKDSFQSQEKFKQKMKQIKAVQRIGIGLLLVFGIPFLHSTFERRRRIEERQSEQSMRYMKKYEQVSYDEVEQRIVY